MLVPSKVTKADVPQTMSHGSAEYAGVKQDIDNTNFTGGEALKIVCENAGECTKAMNSIKRYLDKKGLKDTVGCKKDNLTIWIQSKA